MQIIKSIDRGLITSYCYMSSFLNKLTLNEIEEGKKQYYAGLITFIIVVFVAFITWALGDTLCWMRGKKSFSFVIKLSEGLFKLGCR